jgi:hypothetical protein
MTTLTALALTVLADDTPRNTGPDFGKASPFGLLVVVVLLIATFMLVWSMNRHLTKLPENFGDDIDGAVSAGLDPDAPESPEEGRPHRESGG